MPNISPFSIHTVLDRALGLARPLLVVVALALAPWASANQAHVDSLNGLGPGFVFSNIEESVSLFGEAADEARTLGYQAGEARALQHLGVALYLSGQYEEGVEVTLKAIRIFEDLEMPRELAQAYGELGYQMKRRHMERATEFMLRGIAIAEAGTDSVALCTLYDNFGVIQEMEARPDSAAFYYAKALEYKTALDDSLGIPFSLNNLSGIAAQEGRMGDAEALLRKSDDIRHATADSFGLLQNSIQWAELFFMQGELDTAASRYEHSLLAPGTLEHDYMVSFCFERLAAIYEQKKDFEQAYHNQLRFTAYRDSLFNVENNARMAALELEFETEKKDRQLAENQLAIAARSRQIFFLGAALVVLLLSGIAVARYQHMKRRQLQLEHELRSRVRKAEYKQRMAAEKLRISRELHDNIGAQLTFMTSSIDNIAHRSGSGEFKEGLDSISEFGRGTLGELRQTVWAMKAEGEGFEALANKLQDLRRQCGGTGRPLEFTSSLEPGTVVDLSSGRMLNVYRIAQEAVQNAMKHTTDGPISLDLSAGPNGLVLRVVDQGPGFREKEVAHLGGLAHMRQRCVDSGGHFELNSGEAGTEIVCRFPAE